MAKKKLIIDDFAGKVKHRFDAVVILADHKRRIERLEVEMKDLRDMLAIR